MANSPTKESVLNALKGIKAPGGGDLVSAGILSEIVIAKDKVYFALSVPQSQASAYEPVRKAAEDAAKALPGVANAVVTLTADAKEGGAPAPQAGAGGIGGVKYIIAVASGKGGVGKSTTAVNLALGFQQNGLRVGVLDADIYGPSLPRLLAIKDRPELIGDSVLKPVEKYGLEVMSMGFLVDEETPMIWRGPMVISAITQMLKDVAWGELDIMVVDMPPGTGDAQLTMAQQVPLAGAVIVSTPQDLSLIDAQAGPQHVQARGRARARHHREYELLPLPQMRRALGHLQPWRRQGRGRKAAACRSWASCRCICRSANPPTPATRL